MLIICTTLQDITQKIVVDIILEEIWHSCCSRGGHLQEGVKQKTANKLRNLNLEFFHKYKIKLKLLGIHTKYVLIKNIREINKITYISEVYILVKYGKPKQNTN